MTLEIGDTVHTTKGKLYIVRSFWNATRGGPSATLAPLQPGPHRQHSNSRVETLTLIRTRELSLVFHYASMSEVEGLEEKRRAWHRRRAAHWLTKAEERNDDSRAALCLGSDRVLELEAVAS